MQRVSGPAGTFEAATFERAVRESWTQDDWHSSLLQSSLVSYRSRETYAEVFGGDDVINYPRYINSAPEDYSRNCPWNDWTPPSESRRIFNEAASAQRVDRVSLRVRVRIVQLQESGHKEVIVFATLEVNNSGNECIVLRRGAVELASLTKREIRMTPHPDAPGLHVLTARNPNLNAPLILLRFENTRRHMVFENMLALAA